MKKLNKIRIIRKKNIVVTISIICTLTVLFIGLYYFEYGELVSTQSLIIQEIRIDGNKLSAIGTTSNSGLGYSGCKYKIQNENLYLQLRYSLVNRINPCGDFHIKIQNDDLKNIKNVYLQGKQRDDTKLIWN